MGDPAGAGSTGDSWHYQLELRFPAGTNMRYGPGGGTGLPSGGEPQPRPGFEALRTVKRGMTRADVQRLVGQPSYVEPSSGGWTTWYYGYGRSISFDGRGRAQSFVGFPSP